MKRITGMLLTLAMIFTTIIPTNIFASETAFSDLTGNEYYAEGAEILAGLGILTGYEDGSFRADRSISRAEMAAVICRMIGMENEAKESAGKTDFDDVADEHWASGYINIAVKEGIINGDGNGKFRPEDDVKYEEAIKMIVCALGYAENVSVDPQDWSKAYLDIAKERGITDNLKGEKGKPATRGDIAVMTHNGVKASGLFADKLQKVAPPVASVKEGEYKTARKVKLTTATEGAVIYYTTDGKTPTVKSTKYTKEISIAKTTTLKAIAVKDGSVLSEVMSATYTIRKTYVGGGGGGSSSGTSVAAYIINFDLNYDGAVNTPAAQSIQAGNKAAEPTPPTREGYVFTGWTTEKNKGVIFDFSANVTASVTLYALWSKGTPDNTYKVTFMMNDGSDNVHAVQLVAAGGKATVPQEPTRDFYEFTGWYTEEGAINFYDFYSSVTEDITVYAGWNETSADAGSYISQADTETVYSITEMEMKDGVVYTTINTNSQAALVLKFLDENTKEVIAVASASTPDYGELLSIGVPVSGTLPEYFIITADLYDGNSQKLCDTYTCIYYTSAYEKFDRQTVDDFEPERVISFDGSATNNFGVLNESVIRISCSDVVNKLSVTENDVSDGDAITTDREYTFENPDSSITALKSGDKIYIDSTAYLFKIDTVSNIDGKIVMTESADTNVCEFYDVLKVNMPSANNSARARGRDIASYSFPYSLPNPFSPTIESDYFDVSLTNTLNGAVKVAFAYDVDNFSDNYFYCMVINDMTISISMDANIKTGVSNDDKLSQPEQQVEFKRLDVYTGIPGIFVGVKPAFIYGIELSAGAHVERSIRSQTGFTFSTINDEIQKIEQIKSNIFKLDTNAALSFKLGIATGVNVNLLKGAFSAGITGEGGIKADCTLNKNISDNSDFKHACGICVNGNRKWYVDVYASLDYSITDDIEGTLLRFDIIDKEFPFDPSQFYVSVSNDEASEFNGKVKFDWGECPNIIYKTTIIVKDANGNDLPSTEVFVTRNDGLLSVQGDSPYTEYLYPGTYTALVTINGKDIKKTFTVKDKKQSIELVGEKEEYGPETGAISFTLIDQDGETVELDSYVYLQFFRQNDLATPVGTLYEGINPSFSSLTGKYVVYCYSYDKTYQKSFTLTEGNNGNIIINIEVPKSIQVETCFCCDECNVIFCNGCSCNACNFCRCNCLCNTCDGYDCDGCGCDNCGKCR